MKQAYTTVDDYIQSFPGQTRVILKALRKIVLENAPDAVERIAYGMPAYTCNNKPLVYFAGYTKHIGFYATPTGHEKFKQPLSVYKQGKGSVQFPLGQPIPFSLVADIVRFRVMENQKKS